jgi:hypothetical protein
MARKKPPPATDEDYYLALGKALAAWGSVESVLDHILFQLMRPCDPMQIGRVFFAVANFRDRLNMVNAAAEHRLKGKQSLVTWHKLRDQTAKRSRRRNEIAHAMIWTGPESGTYGSRPLPYLIDLPKEWKKRKQLVLTPKALGDAAKLFDELFDNLAQFHKTLLESKR